MISYINKFKIPTLLGLTIIMAGTVAGVYFGIKDQSLLSFASPNLTPQNITFTNIEDQTVAISWQTLQPTISFITFGKTSVNEQTALDERDGNTPKIHRLHYVTIKNLQPQTTYQLKIISGKTVSQTLNFTTSLPSSNQNGFGPVIGTIADGENPLDQGIVYLSISGAITQSALVKNLGNFLIPISFMRKSDLSDIYKPNEGDIAKLTVISDKGQSSALFKLKSSGQPLPLIRLGQNVDLVNPEIFPSPTPTAQELNKYDLNEDRFINANDHAIILQNFGKSPKNKKADLNGDGVVDQKDLDLMGKQINQ